MCRALVGLADIDVVGVIPWTVPMQAHVASTLPRPTCTGCGTSAQVKQTMRRRLVDLPSFGQPVVTVWRQVRWRCPAPGCQTKSWMQTDRRSVVGNRGMTDRAARWACEQVGRHGRSVAEVAADLGCDWHTVNRAVVAYGLALPDNPDRRCFAHTDRLAAVRDDARRRGGVNSSTVARFAASTPPLLADTLDTLTGALDEVAAGRMPATCGQAVAALGRAIAAVYSEHAVEQRLDDLERQLGAVTAPERLEAIQ